MTCISCRGGGSWGSWKIELFVYSPRRVESSTVAKEIHPRYVNVMSYKKIKSVIDTITYHTIHDESFRYQQQTTHNVNQELFLPDTTENISHVYQ